MRIAHLTPVFPPYRGGMGSVAYHQAEALADLGVQVTVFTPASDTPRLTPRGVEVVELTPLLRYGNAACLPQILGRCRDFDIVHLHYPFFGTAELAAARRLIGGPPLFVQYQMDVVGVSWKATLFEWHRRLAFPAILRAADRILVTSLDYAESSQFLGKRMPSLDERVRVLPAGVDTAVFQPRDRAAARRDLRLPDGPLVFFLSRLDRAHYFKGLHVLVRALRNVPDATLVVGGAGELQPRYESHAAEHLGRRALFVGDISDRDLPSYYAAADVVVLPSVDRTEAFGLVLLEAMACGTPVVASRLRGVQTLVEDGRSGYLVTAGNEAELADRIGDALRNRDELGRRARESVAAFGWHGIASRLKEIYEGA